MKRSPSRAAVATDVWRLLTGFVMDTFRERSDVLAELGLTPGHLKTLRALEPDTPLPMGACAQAIGCDASTATWMIDRLEQRGLVERRPSPTDRRVKAVVLTPEGVALKATLARRFDAPPDALRRLDHGTLAELQRVFTDVVERHEARASLTPGDGYTAHRRLSGT